MPRPKKQPQDRVKKDSFSGPGYLIAAAKKAAGVQHGADFSPWLALAIREKLERDHKGLIESTRAQMMRAAEAYEEREEEDQKDGASAAAEGAGKFGGPPPSSDLDEIARGGGVPPPSGESPKDKGSSTAGPKRPGPKGPKGGKPGGKRV